EVDQRLQLDRKDLLVPGSIERELVVGKDVGPSFGVGEVRQRQARHCLSAEQVGRLDAAMTGDDLAVIRHEHRVGEPKALDRGGDLLELFRGMGARVIRVRAERSDGSFRYGGIARRHVPVLQLSQRWSLSHTSSETSTEGEQRRLSTDTFCSRMAKSGAAKSASAPCNPAVAPTSLIAGERSLYQTRPVAVRSCAVPCS